MTLDEEVSDLFGFPFRQATRDAAGNALGGVRLPHMTSTVDGRQAGAPLGTYDGFEFNTQDPFIFIGGHFTPFEPPRLEALYPSHGAYVHKVAQAAHRLVKRREILEEDSVALIREAERSTIGRPGRP